MNEINLLNALSDNIVIDKDKCVVCGVCVETCILDNLRMKVAPCRAACPLDVNVQGYVQQIARGDDEGGRQTLRRTMIFPEILGRICPQPCEEACHRGSVDGGPVAIRALKRYLIDGQKAEAIPLPETAPDFGRTVAVVGSGPAGLNAAHDLRVRGHAVTILEAAPEPGGMLRWAVPEFRLPTEVVERELSLLPRMGIDIRCGVRVGREVTLDELKRDFDAVVVAAGCGDFVRLRVKGKGLKGVYDGLPLLRAVRSGKAPKLSGRVVIVGGGCVAVESAQTALQLGAKSATLVCLEGPDEMPAFRWSQESAMAEGVTFDHGWGPVRLIEKSGSVAGIEIKRCFSVTDEAGNFKPTYDRSDTKTLKTDAVIVAIGQARDVSCLRGKKDKALVEDNNVRADPLTLQSVDGKVFVAGDFFTGPTSVVKAMASGRQAAISVDRYLRNEHLRYGRTYPGPVETDYEIDTSRGSSALRSTLPTRNPEGVGDFGEIEGKLSKTHARKEAGRCYSCGTPFGKYRTCWFCLPCEVECPHDALWVEVPYLLR